MIAEGFHCWSTKARCNDWGTHKSLIILNTFHAATVSRRQF